jgi:hypothetical protein
MSRAFQTYSIILNKCLVRQETMTKNSDFGHNRKNRSTSNACRIAGAHNAFSFFCLKNTYIIVEQKKLQECQNVVTYSSHPHKKFPSNHSKMVTKFAVAGWV